jgi:hypothetical protein
MPEWFGGSALNPDMIFPRNEQWKIQWHRVVRWHKRVVDLRSNQALGLDVGDIDVVIAFFQNCYHLRDWLHATRPDLSANVDAFYADTFEMAACRDICHGYKHKLLTRPSLDAGFNLCREYDHFDNAAPVNHRWAFADGDNIRRFDLFDLAERCFAFCERFIFDVCGYRALVHVCAASETDLKVCGPQLKAVS